MRRKRRWFIIFTSPYKISQNIFFATRSTFKLFNNAIHVYNSATQTLPEFHKWCHGWFICGCEGICTSLWRICTHVCRREVPFISWPILLLFPHELPWQHTDCCVGGVILFLLNSLCQSSALKFLWKSKTFHKRLDKSEKGLYTVSDLASELTNGSSVHIDEM